MSDWKNNRPENWEYQIAIQGDYDNVSDGKKWDIAHSCGWRDGYEAGADAMYKAMMEQRPSNDEIKAKFIACLYGGSDVPELLEWLKEKLLVKEK